jgi:hypothetical protein
VDEGTTSLAPVPLDEYQGAMTKAGPTGRPAVPRSTGRDARTERLAAALKANLRRRKAQARERAAEADQPGHHSEQTEPAEAHDSARVVVDKRSG